MHQTRRHFLKTASLATAGLAATAGSASLAQATPLLEEKNEALRAVRWGMAIYTRAFESREELDALARACHSYHNVPTIEGPQEVKWLWTDNFTHTFPMAENEYQSHEVEERDYLLLCNHCDHPPCVRVCPTQATFRRDDGIVMMDMHRCIGCRFCMAGCPYGSRSFNFQDPRPFIDTVNPAYPTRMKGVVEKCTFCAERLSKGMQPACVEAAEGKIVFGDLNDPGSELRRVLAESYTVRRKPDLGTHPSVFYII